MICLPASAGCAAQLGASAQHHGPERDLGWAVDVDGRLVDVLGIDGAYASGHVALADPDDEALFGVRQGMVGGGYRVMRSCVTLEAGAELGAGEPTLVDYDGMGFYSGAVGSLLFRVYGDQDREPGFAPVAVMFDIATTWRTGVWFPPTQSDNDVVFERSMQGGLRVTIISDLFDASGREFEP